MSDDLITRVRAAIEEKMRIAREATAGPWVVRWQDGEVGVDVEPADRTGYYIVCPDSAAGLDERDARHIALHDPQDTLRGCEADLRVLDRHVPEWIKYRSWCTHCERLWPCVEILDRAYAHNVPVEASEASA